MLMVKDFVFPCRKTLSHTDDVRADHTGSYRNQEPTSQPAGHQVAARVAAGLGQKEETQRCFGQTGGGKSRCQSYGKQVF